jgi:hypothetical protein
MKLKIYTLYLYKGDDDMCDTGTFVLITYIKKTKSRTFNYIEENKFCWFIVLFTFFINSMFFNFKKAKEIHQVISIF